MIYILMIWTAVAASDSKGGPKDVLRDWRPLGEFHMEEGRMGKKTAQEMCEDAARQLGLRTEKYRCVRSK
jgi:hypothetical protein